MILNNKNYSQFFSIQNFQAFELKKNWYSKIFKQKKTDILKLLNKKTDKNWDFLTFSKKTDLAWCARTLNNTNTSSHVDLSTSATGRPGWVAALVQVYLLLLPRCLAHRILLQRVTLHVGLRFPVKTIISII